MSQHDPKNDPSINSSTNTKPITQSSKSGRSKWLGWVWSTFKYLALFLVIYTAINWWRQPVMPADPQLQLTDYRGKMVDLEQLSHDSPILVYFWGTWCGVCKVTSPTINALAEDSDYPIVTIAIQSGDEQTLQQYLTQHDYHFTTINDPNGDIFQQWRGQVTPSYVILKNGEMTQGLTGIQPKWSLKLRLWLSALG